MTNTMVLNSSFIELSNEEMLGVDGGWWNMHELSERLCEAGALITFLTPAKPLGEAIGIAGVAIGIGAHLGDAYYNATHK